MMASVSDEYKKNLYQDAENLRMSNRNHFETLCKMHLSFLLDLQHSDFESVIDGVPVYAKENNKNIFIHLSKKSSKAKNAEGKLLTLELAAEAHQLIKYLNTEENIHEEGLFRKNGKKSRQKELRCTITLKRSIDCNSYEYSAHDYANLLKTFLSELSEPLLTEAHYPAHCQIPNLCPSHMKEPHKSTLESRQIQALQLLFLLLPSENRTLLQDLLSLLHKVSKAEHSNRMNANNLATVFAPHILCPRKMTAEQFQINSGNMIRAVSFMIEHANELFQIPDVLIEDSALCWQNRTGIKVEADKEANDAVTTCLTFCDRRQELHGYSTTTGALAELYAYVLKMPDSARKRKYLKQFKKEKLLLPPSSTNVADIDDCVDSGKKSFTNIIKKRLFSQRKQSNVSNQRFESKGEYSEEKTKPETSKVNKKKKCPLNRTKSLSSLTEITQKVHALTNSSSPLLLRVRSNVVTPISTLPLYSVSGDKIAKEKSDTNPSVVVQQKPNTNKWLVCNYLTNKAACRRFSGADLEVSDREDQVMCCLFDKAKIPVLKLYKRLSDQDFVSKKEAQPPPDIGERTTAKNKTEQWENRRISQLKQSPSLRADVESSANLFQEKQVCRELWTPRIIFKETTSFKADKLRCSASFKFASTQECDLILGTKSFSCSNIIINNNFTVYRETAL